MLCSTAARRVLAFAVADDPLRLAAGAGAEVEAGGLPGAAGHGVRQASIMAAMSDAVTTYLPATRACGKRPRRSSV